MPGPQRPRQIAPHEEDRRLFLAPRRRGLDLRSRCGNRHHRCASQSRLSARGRARLWRYDTAPIPRLHRRGARLHRQGSQEARRGCRREDRIGTGDGTADRHIVEGLQAARRTCANHSPRPARAGDGRTDRRPRPQSEAQRAQADPRHGGAEVDHHFHASVGRGRSGVHARRHHRPRADRGRRHAVLSPVALASSQRRHVVAADRTNRRRESRARSAAGRSFGRRDRAHHWCRDADRLSARQYPDGRTCQRARQRRALGREGTLCRGRPAGRCVPRHHNARCAAHPQARGDAPMRPVLAIFKREFAAYFATPVAYVFIVIFLLAMGAFTFSVGHFYDNGVANLSVFFAYHPWLYLFLVPAVGMRLWAEERRLGTMELLLTLPIPIWASVLGKFLAAWAFIGVALLLTFPIWITVNYLGNPDNGVIVASYVGTFLMAGADTAVP